MRNYILLLLILILSIGCRSRQVVVNEEKQSASINVQLSKESEITKEIELLKQMVETSRVSSFSSALNLTPVVDSSGVSQPVTYRELRDGKPFREIHIVGGSLNENKRQSDTIKGFQYKELTKENSILKMKLDSVMNSKFKAGVKSKDVKVTGMQAGVYIIAGVVLLMLIPILYLEFRIRSFKRSLTRL